MAEGLRVQAGRQMITIPAEAGILAEAGTAATAEVGMMAEAGTVAIAEVGTAVAATVAVGKNMRL